MLTQKMNVKPLLKIFVQSKQSINGKCFKKYKNATRYTHISILN